MVYGATRITGDVLFQPMLNENVDQLLPETGILVSDDASPTLLNNLLANLNAGIWQDASPTTVVGGSIYQHNDVADANVGSTNDDFNIHMGDYAPLFVNSADGNFYPAPMSPIIDSAIDSLEERVGSPPSRMPWAFRCRRSWPPIWTPPACCVRTIRKSTRLPAKVPTCSRIAAVWIAPTSSVPDAVLIVPRDNDQARHRSGSDRHGRPTGRRHLRQLHDPVGGRPAVVRIG